MRSFQDAAAAGTKLTNTLIITIVVLCSKVKAQSYIPYHEQVNLAEYHFVHKQFDSALYLYDKAFSTYDFIFVKDALIAAQIAWKQGDKTRTARYLIKGAESGLRTDCLNSVPILRSYMDSREFNAVYDSMKTALRRYHFLDHALADEWVLRGSELNLSEDKSEFFTVVQQNVARIKDLLAAGKFPGEKWIGINSNCAELENLTVFNSLANYDCVISELHDQLWNAVKQGELHPREFATLWEWEYIRSARNQDVLTPQVARAILQQNIDVRMKDVPSAVTNPNCNRAKQKFRRFGLLLSLAELSDADVNKTRRDYLICDLETDEKKREFQQRENYKFFWTVK